MRRRLVLTALLAVVSLATVGAALQAGLPRLRRRLALQRAIERARAATPLDLADVDALTEFDEPEALLVQLEVVSRRTDGMTIAVLDSIELFAATPEPRDPRPREALRRIAGDPRAAPIVRFGALYGLELLDRPTFPGVPRADVRAAQQADLASRTWTAFDELDAEAILLGFSRALDRKVVAVLPAKLVLPEGRCRYRFGDRRALAALAELNGCEVRERDATTLEIVKEPR